MRCARRTPLGAFLRGLVAGAAGIAAMDASWYLRYRLGGGDRGPLQWEFGGEPEWDKVSTRGQIGRRLIEGFTQRPLPARWAVLTNNVMHWGYGLGWSGVYGLVVGSVPRPRVGYGSAVWLDLGGRMIHGTMTALTFRALT